jgi:hypothetical protein
MQAVRAAHRLQLGRTQQTTGCLAGKRVTFRVAASEQPNQPIDH